MDALEDRVAAAEVELRAARAARDRARRTDKMKVAMGITRPVRRAAAQAAPTPSTSSASRSSTSTSSASSASASSASSASTSSASSASAAQVPKKNISSVVTKEQNKTLKQLYTTTYSHEDSYHDRLKARVSAANRVGVPVKVVTIKYGEFHRGVKRKAEKAKKDAAAAAAKSPS